MRFSTILLILVLAACSQSRSSATDAEFAKKVQCLEAGRRLFESKYQKAVPDGLIDLMPEYGYSQKLNTCVLYVAYFDFINRSQSTEYLIDVLANQVVANTSRVNDATHGLSQEEFDRHRRMLFPGLSRDEVARRRQALSPH
jgi:hypothetical protein